MEDKKDRIIETYEYYTSILDVMLSDISGVSLSDIQDCIDELREELERIEKDEMSANYSKQ